MSVLKGLRRMFGHRTVEELDGEIDPAVESTKDRRDHSSTPDRPAPSPSIAPPTTSDRLAEIETAVAVGRELQDRTVSALEQIPRTREQIEHLVTGQDRLADLLQAIRRDLEDEATEHREHHQRLGDFREHERELFRTIERHLEANHDVMTLSASKMEAIADVVRDTSHANQRTADALVAVVEELREQESRHEERAGVLQGWIITCAVACIGAMAAALALAWTVMETRG